MKRKERECHGTSDQLDHIPDDLTVEILGRLPGTALMKFQCVSKIWFSIIRSQRFIDSFLSKSLNSRLLITFNSGQFTNKNAEKRLFFFTASYEVENKSSSSSLVANLDMTIPSTNIDHYYTRGTLARGFICCSSYQGRFLICNPTTKQLVTLPTSGDNVRKFTYKYLGYDPIDDQYKALCMMVSRCKHDDLEHKVLTLGVGGGDNRNFSWRQIEDNTEPYVPSTKGICINGVVYYGATRPNTNRVIVCFDVKFEKISLMNLPFGFQNWELVANLINYKGKLAVIHTKDFGSFHGFILWILENAEKNEWSKKTCEFPPSWLNSIERHSYSYIGINKTGEIILAPKLLPRNLEPFYIFYYDLTSQDMRKVRLEGIADDEEFIRHYGIGNNGACRLSISSEHFENITFLARKVVG